MDDLRELVEACLLRDRGEHVRGVEQLPGGANSLVYRIASAEGRSYLAKRYLRRPGDTSDRLETEFSGLSFLWSRGVRAIPEPVCRSAAEGVGVYAFIEGEKLRPGEVTAGHVEQAARFLRRLHDLRGDPAARLVPMAKEACFSLDAYAEVVRVRLDRLTALPSPVGTFRLLASFLWDDLGPFFREVAEWVNEEAAARGLGPGEELPADRRTLSPSDFGFHNAIRQPDGNLVFIDFEYWGWDDPAKMVADFYLQPAVPVPVDLRTLFHDRAASFLDREDLARRLPLVYPLLALKWCLIMLNLFARTAPGSGDDDLLRGQLDKSSACLKRTREEFHARAFPLNLT